MQELFSESDVEFVLAVWALDALLLGPFPCCLAFVLTIRNFFIGLIASSFLSSGRFFDLCRRDRIVRWIATQGWIHIVDGRVVQIDIAIFVVAFVIRLLLDRSRANLYNVKAIGLV